MRTVCVMGMHRSGTSLLTRVTNLLGVDLGDNERILPPGGDNLAGYWENSDILRLNNTLLKHFGGSWDHPPHLPGGWEDREDLATFRSQALAGLKSFSEDSEFIGWKDPRLSILLPFWRTVSNVDHTIVAIRHPAAVAASLQYRNGFTLQHATALWVRYTLEALVNAPDSLILSYDDMLADTERLARRVADYLRLPAPDSPTLRQVREFAQPELAHQTERLAPDSPDMRFASNLFEEIASGTGGLDFDRFRAIVSGQNEAAHPVTEQVAGLRKELEDERENSRRLRREQQRAEKDSRALERERRRARELDLRSEFENARRRRLRLRLDQVENNARHAAKLESDLRGELREARREYNQLRSRIAVRLALPVAQVVRQLVRRAREVRERVPRNKRVVEEDDSASRRSGGQTARFPNTPEKTQGLQKSDSGPEFPSEKPRKIPSHEGEGMDSCLGAIRAAMPISIVVPVYNAVDDLRRCVDSVRRNTTLPAELLLIDDASTDLRVASYLGELEGTEGVRVLYNTENLGFSGTINRGIRESKGDVVALNSDAEVTPRWLTNLALAAYKHPTVGTVTPVSDNAGAFSVPELGKHNATPPGLSKDEVGRLVTRTSRRVYPDTPTANGVCMYLKKSMIDTVGLLDEESFPRGYGEENDYCMRAKKAGWRHIVDDATFIFHAGSASFGEEKQALLKAGLAKVEELHPEYPALVQPFVRGSQMQLVRETVRSVYEDPPSRCLPGILHVIHEGAGGVISFNDDLVSGLNEHYEHFQLASDARSLTLRRYDGRGWIDIEQCPLEPPVSVLDHQHSNYRHEAVRILEEYGIEVVHIQNLIYHSHDLPLAADTMGIAVVATLHDYFLICPTIQLIDDQGRFCGGTCTPGQGKCYTGMQWVRDNVPHLKHAWVHEWKRRLSEVLLATDALVAPTEAVRQVYLRAYPGLASKRIQEIGHGIDLPEKRLTLAPQGDNEPIRVLALGNINDQKGAKVLENVVSLDADRGEIELHILGAIRPAYRSLGHQHGPYSRKELPELIEKINPTLVALLSPWGETFCYTLSEAWAYDIPVVAADVGALGQRVRAQGGGWVVDPNDPKSVYQTILKAGRDSETYGKAATAARDYRPRSVAEMAADYDALYQEVLAKRCLSSGSITAATSTLRNGGSS